VDFERTYHAILGRPALAKFIIVPHYVYLLLKMPTEKGMLTLRGNMFIAYTCEKEGFATVEDLELLICMQESEFIAYVDCSRGARDLEQGGYSCCCEV
jgi:hypothetical protein